MIIFNNPREIIIMKKSIVVVILVLNQLCLVQAQNTYKQDLLDFLKVLPDIKTCEGSYDFLKGKDNRNASYKAAETNLEKAFNELTSAMSATSNAMTSNVQTTSMSQADADAMSAKLDKMTPEEKQQWAMQNAMNMMNPSAVYSNEDAGNDAVNNAVDYINKQQQEEFKEITKPTNIPAQYQSIEDKYKSQKDAVLKDFRDASGTDYDPSSPIPYITGESSKEEAAKFDLAYNNYKNKMGSVLNAELNDKIAYLSTLAQNVISKYTPLEIKVAATHYGDDAKENMNKNQLLMAQQTVLGKISQIFDEYDKVLIDYANRYADLQKIDRVK
jgi:hypothetical protein